MKTGILFTTKNCPNCPPVKKLLDEKGFEYELVDAHENMDLVKEYGLTSVPALIIGPLKFIGLEEIQTMLSKA